MKLEINHKLAGLVPMASEAEQASLTRDIKERGQLEPIILWKGKIIDGRCRQISCKVLEIDPKIKELPWNTSEEDARYMVKSLNTRRNLTLTQKIMCAVRTVMNSSCKATQLEIAKEWGISIKILKNALYIARTESTYIETLFNGGGVKITNSRGENTTSNKVSAIYSYLRKREEQAEEISNHGWCEDTYIKTQLGKEWYYSRMNELGKEHNTNLIVRMDYAELANLKFKLSKTGKEVKNTMIIDSN